MRWVLRRTRQHGSKAKREFEKYEDRRVYSEKDEEEEEEEEEVAVGQDEENVKRKGAGGGGGGGRAKTFWDCLLLIQKVTSSVFSLAKAQEW